MAENTIPETLNGIKVDESTLRSSNPFDKTTGVNTAAPTGGAKTDKYANNNLIKNSNIDTKDAIVPKPRKVKRRPSYIGWAIGMLLRLFTWYSIYTIAFNCPSSADELTDISPKVCKPYFQAKAALSPHVTPYYEKYAAPYVETAKPYYDTLDKNVIVPAAYYGKKYGGPRVAQAHAFGKTHWDKHVQPQVAKLNEQAQAQYDQHLAAHVNKVSGAVGPYAKLAKDNAQHTYYATILPAYSVAHPYLVQGYEHGRDFTVNTGYPYAKWGVDSVISFLDRNVWPQIKILYGENVEPQLVRIGERLGRYRDRKKLKAAVEEIHQSAITSASSSSVSSVSSSISQSIQSSQSSSESSKVARSQSTTTTTSTSTVSVSEVPAETPLSEAEQREKAQKVVADDLKIWREKFAKATDEGSIELQERIAEITERAIKNQALSAGNAHITLLEETVKSEMKGLKKSILSIVKLKYTPEDIDRAVRKAGLNIKDKAQAVRAWRQKYDGDVNEMVAKAAEDTFQIIDHIRDLGLQEIGMRWAWTDGVTHKDWAKYHALKNKFDEWRHDVEDAATQHPGLAHSRAASKDIEGRAMDIAQGAAKELARLKETGKWKLEAGDASDDFSTKHMPAAAHVAAQKVMGVADDASVRIYGTSTGAVESAMSAAQSRFSEASAVAQSSLDKALNMVRSEPTKTGLAAQASSSYSSALSAASAAMESASKDASVRIYGTPTGAVESAMSVAKSRFAEASAAAQSNLDSALNLVRSEPGKTGFVAHASASFSSSLSAASAAFESVSRDASIRIYGTPTGALESAMSVAQSHFADASAAAQSNLDKVLHLIKNEPTKTGLAAQATASFSSSLSAASAALDSISREASIRIYGTPTGDLESAMSAVQSQYSVASEAAQANLDKALKQFQKEPTKTGLAAQASSSYSSALSAASAAMDSASRDASIRIYGTPTGALESGYSAVQSQFASATDLAQKRLDDALYLIKKDVQPPSYAERAQSSYSSAISEASAYAASASREASIKFYGTPQGSVESVTSVIGESVASAAAEASKSAESVASSLSRRMASTSTGSAASVIAAAQASASSLAKKASLGVVGSSTGTIESVASAVKKSAESVASQVSASAQSVASEASNSVYGTPQSSVESAMSVAKSRFAEASAAAQSNLDKALHLIKNEPTKTGLAAQASSSYSSALSAASAAMESASRDASIRIYGTPTGAVESAASAAKASAQSVIDMASSSIIGTSTGSVESMASAAKNSAESVASQASSSAQSVASMASASIYGAPQGTIGSMASAAKSSVSSVVDKASSSIIGTSQGTVESVTSVAAASASSVMDEAAKSASSISSVASASAMSASSELSKSISSASSVASSSASKASSIMSKASATASKKVWGGAHAPQ